ncbi:putative short-chain dehydrogenase [Colletotrichum zoysiae]|uniref:Short-chain dehydrogenase n=1 Tax=Colletotrichum zoysiae TaxID=1216348 RepID=A0AAD9H6Q3_9PEZI|nr:putative short-chain dehydrogenase [Colletotrichum zoysiae]
MPSYLVTGSSRGLGLGFATELLKRGNSTVIATARNTAKSQGLQELRKNYPDDRLVLLDMDVMDPESVNSAAESVLKLLPSGLDNLVSNAGISYSPLKSLDEMDLEEYKDEILFNVVAPVTLFRAFVPLIRKSQDKKILIITSTMGSIELAEYTPNMGNAYSVSKAALNMVGRKYSTVLKNDGIITALLHPGLVGATDMGSSVMGWMTKNAPTWPSISIEQSAADCMSLLDGLIMEQNGGYFNHDGTKLPW